MNMILKGVPSDVIINGCSYLINTDFRIGMQFEQLAMQQTDENELLKKALKLYYPLIPQDESAAVDALIWFYNCGKPQQETSIKSQGTSSSTQLYDYDFDVGYIYAAFLEQYQIDLMTAQFHWWKFRALFLSLSPELTFSKIMSYRSADATALKGAERKRIESLKEIYKIPLPISAQEKIADIKHLLRTTGKLN